MSGSVQGVHDQVRGACGAENLERHQAGAGRRAGHHLTTRQAGGDRGNVSAVASLIQRVFVGMGDGLIGSAVRIRVVRGAREVVAGDDFGGGEGARLDDVGVVVGVILGVPAAAQSDVGVVNAGINDGNDDGWSRFTPLDPFGGTAISVSGGVYRLACEPSPNAEAFGPARCGSLRRTKS